MRERVSNFRREYLAAICRRLLFVDESGVPNWADKDSPSSVSIGKELVELMPDAPAHSRLSPQEVGAQFQEITRRFIEGTFTALLHARPGTWRFDLGGHISQYYQYEHLALLDNLAKQYPDLRALLGAEYLVKPDIIIARHSEEDAFFDPEGSLFTEDSLPAPLTPARRANYRGYLLHAIISCKWTIRSDRAQNTRTEALNIIRNRKGHTPRIVAVTADPMPTRISSLALGAGDIECVYHIALPELKPSHRYRREPGPGRYAWHAGRREEAA
ncbi:MAG: type II restriction endonuclease NgoMIV [Armatimonadota bacterium]|nr:MAG: type II restriction endonuclease NgoMIV [Armatimonadota bacterium]